MTNPRQFNYLDAMEIPVWVSRDLLAKVDALKLKTDTTELLDKDRQPCPDSAQDVLESLSQAQQAFAEEKKQVANKQEGHTEPLPHSLNEDFPNQIGKTALHWLFAQGNRAADWMVIGVSPDKHESPINQPYPYDAGVLLNNMLRAVGLKQPADEAYLLNVVHVPLKSTQALEQQASKELNQQLIRVINQVQPKILLLVGQLAAQNLLQTTEPLARIRTKQFQQEQVLLPGTEIPVVTTYYPSYLLSKPQDKRKAWEDLKLAISLLQSE